MPELPEVETVMRGLAAVLQGHRIAEAELRRPDLRFPIPPGLARRIEGRRVLSLRRRAKYMLMRLEGGESLLIHLGMSGRMVARRVGEAPVPRLGPQGAASDARGHNAPPEAHEHLVLVTDHGWRVGFVDPRRFGSLDLVATGQEDAHRFLAGLGPEPLEAAFTPAALSAALAGKRTPIKAALLDQAVVAGLGNIYVCEALFRAGISPRRLAPARLRARRWRARPLPGALRRLWPGGRGLPRLPRRAPLPGHRPHRAIGPVHLLLPEAAALRPPPACATATGTEHGEDRGACPTR